MERESTILKKCIVEMLGTGTILAIALYTNNIIAILVILTIMVLLFRNISGAHFNPLFTLAIQTRTYNKSYTEIISYIIAQIIGATIAVLCIINIDRLKKKE